MTEWFTHNHEEKSQEFHTDENLVEPQNNFKKHDYSHTDIYSSDVCMFHLDLLSLFLSSQLLTTSNSNQKQKVTEVKDEHKDSKIEVKTLNLCNDLIS